LLHERFRSSDIVARYGGEEFCVIASNLSSITALDLFDEFRKSLEKMIIEIGETKVSVTVSIGITKKVTEHVETMISAADHLLYQAKHEGRNRVLID